MYTQFMFYGFQDILGHYNTNIKATLTNKNRFRKENAPKVKALNETVIRLSKSNEQLQAENRALKDDLHRALEESDAKLDTKSISAVSFNELFFIFVICTKDADNSLFKDLQELLNLVSF